PRLRFPATRPDADHWLPLFLATPANAPVTTRSIFGARADAPYRYRSESGAFHTVVFCRHPRRFPWLSGQKSIFPRKALDLIPCHLREPVSASSRLIAESVSGPRHGACRPE